LDGILSIKRGIITAIEKAALKAQQQGKLPEVNLPEISIEHPQKTEHGDYATSLPLKMARATSMNPLVIAESITAFIEPATEVAEVTVAPPGFINFRLSDSWLAGQIDEILSYGEDYGSLKLGGGKSVLVEYVSANPTGPIHAGHGRGAVLGSALSNVLTAAGYRVSQEFYVNDAGSQIEAYGASIYARYLQELGQEAEIPDGGYHGEYIKELAQEIIDQDGNKYLDMPQKEATTLLSAIGVGKMLKQIEKDLTILNVSFNKWYNEKQLFNGLYQKVLHLLKEKGFTDEKEGAIWFTSTALGEDKDNVIVRSDGSPTYFASDIAYHYDKFINREFDNAVNVWGADHQGHVSRMKAVLGALGVEPSRLKIIISQMVTLKRGKELVRLSKRSGEIITLKEVIDEVGADACRFFFLARSADAQMDFDLELAKKESAENPVYYIQYAHARIASIFRLAAEKGITYTDGDVALLDDEAELELVRRLMLLPEVIERAALAYEPHHLAYYAQELATVFHSFYNICRVISADEERSKARLKLVAAVKLVLKRTLSLIGATVPDRM
jgi:arginyl-tRNA synthetase